MDDIRLRLREIEQDENVTIVYACESGSRAWGFPSKDSDFDVRFLYLRTREWYLTIDFDEKSNVIERPINNMLDISGWDLRKALKLLYKSNPPLMEWLSSPIIYQEQREIVNQIRGILPEYYSPRSCMYHYVHMAQGNFREYLRGDIVWIKKYFYVLRPLLAIKWIENESSIVPMEFSVLVDRCVESSELKAAIEELLERKKAGHELDRAPRINIISDFVESELARLASVRIEDSPRPSTENLNRLFRRVLEASNN